jgi:two-component system response regulator FixJ
MQDEKELPLIGIVDDAESVRAGIDSLVRSAGYRTALFESAEAFLNFERISDIACLVLDVRMPGIGGVKLQHRLAEMNLTLPVIFVSSDDDRLRAGPPNERVIAIFGKPFCDEALLAAIRSALDSGLG